MFLDLSYIPSIVRFSIIAVYDRLPAMSVFSTKVSNIGVAEPDAKYLNQAILAILVDAATFTIPGTKVDVDSGLR
jgi:hypothetical protein